MVVQSLCFPSHLNQSAFEVISERILSEVDGGVLEQTFHTKVVALEYSGFGLFFMSNVYCLSVNTDDDPLPVRS